MAHSNAGFFELDPPPTDAISSLRFAPKPSTKLLVSSWNKFLYLYDVGRQKDSQLITKIEHRAPLLACCFGNNESIGFSGGLDWDVRKVDLGTGHQTVLSTHDAPVHALAYCPTQEMLISASWDQTLHVHRPRRPQDTPSTVSLPAKPFALSLSPTKLVVAMASRLIYIYDLAAMALLSSQSAQPPPNVLDLEPFQSRESSLKFMTRALACMPNDAGYASSSIEGKASVEWFNANPESQARKYAFKCHRQSKEIDGQQVDIVHPVHALAFHPTHGTFASGGGDGNVTLWDAVAKRRLKQYEPFPASVAAVDFSGNGDFLAIGISPSLEQDDDNLAVENVKVFVKELGQNETKGKAK